MTSERDEKAWTTVYDLAQRSRGVFILRMQPCLQCGDPVATPLSADPPQDCSQHSP